MVIRSNYLVKKRNVLNEIRANNMTLQELRFFSIYLSKINPKDLKTRIVRFPITDFQKIMDLGRIKIDYMKSVTNSLLCKVINVPLEKGGYTAFQLFKKCTVSVDDCNEWFVEIDAHDEALPLMFEFKEKYFSYQLWNALRLRSSNQLRMYEILKQYEKIGERILSLEELRQLLGIDKSEYERFGDFKRWVLDVCQEALAENTDLKFTYEPYGKRGKGGKILELRFTITKNTGYIDQLTLEEFINEQESEPSEPDDEDELNGFNDMLSFYAEACGNEFSIAEIQILYDLVVLILSSAELREQTRVYFYFKRKYDELKWRSEKSKINNRFGYIKKIISADLPGGEK